MRDLTPCVQQIERDTQRTVSRSEEEAARAWEQIERIDELLSKLAIERAARRTT
jgi:hypothetical protein